MADKRSKSSGWGLFLLFWTMLLLMLGFLVCVVFYKYTAVYEETRPERTMDALMAEMSEEDWRETLAASAGGVSEYEDARELFDDYFDSTIKGKPISYRLDLSRSDETQTVFALYALSARIGEVRLLPRQTDERFSFGRSQWEVDSITSKTLSDSLQALTVQIEAPDGVTPFLNGKAVGQEKIVDPAVALTQLSELERRFDAPGPRMVRYEIGPLYGQIAVSDPDGNEIAPVGEPEDGVLRYVIMPTTTYSFRVEAPEGVTVSVCGAALGEEQVRSSEQNMFRGLESYLPQGGYKTLLYEVDGLYIEPVIRASCNGVELTLNGWESAKNYIVRYEGNNSVMFPKGALYSVRYSGGFSQVPQMIVQTALQIGDLMWESAGGTLAVSSTSFADTGTRVFNNFKMDRFLEQINGYRIYGG